MNNDEDVDYEALREVFRLEAGELTRSLEEATLLLERSPTDPAPLATMSRIAHTIKGGARMVGFEGIAEFSRAFEELLSTLRARQRAVSSPLTTLFLRAIDVLREGFVVALDGNVTMTPDLDSVRCDLQRASTSLDTTDGLSLEVPRSQEVDNSRVVPEPQLRVAQQGATGTSGAKTLRVRADKLERLLGCVAEILVGRRRVGEILGSQLEFSRDGLLELHHAYDALHQKLDVLASELRMVPLGPLFHEIVRICRDTALDCGKKAQLVIEGEAIEVDAPIAELLREPLLQLVRNAVEHGIESPVQRIRSGKPTVGKVTLNAHREDGCIVVTISDDGEGLDRDRILSYALTRGFIQPDVVLSDAEVQRLILLSGFSTAEVTESSGRGEGLDVVQRNVERVQGDIRIESDVGKGTMFVLKLPLVLAIGEGLRTAGAPFEPHAVAIDAGNECVESPGGAQASKTK